MAMVNSHHIDNHQLFLHNLNSTVNIDLPRNFHSPCADLFELLDNRKSRRKFNQMDLQDLSTLLWFSQRQTGVLANDSDRVKSPYPTVGALASVKTIVLQKNERPWVYTPSNHTAAILPATIDTSNQIHLESHDFFNTKNAVLLLFAADRQLISQYYQHPTSLALREAGILLSTLSLVSEALNLSYCPLGTTADIWLEKLLDGRKEIIIPAGAAVIGRRQAAAIR